MLKHARSELKKTEVAFQESLTEIEKELHKTIEQLKIAQCEREKAIKQYNRESKKYEEVNINLQKAQS